MIEQTIDTETICKRNQLYATAVHAYGLSIGVRTDDQSLLTQLLACMPPGSIKHSTGKVDCTFSLVSDTTHADGRIYKLFKDHSLDAQLKDWQEMLEHFESALGIFVAEHSPHHVFVHAGCVGWNGQAIIIPGRSFSGKTSLVAALLRAGATYYSDEYCVLDLEGLVHPYPRRLSVRNKNGRQRLTAEDFDAEVGLSGISPARLIFTRFTPEGIWQPRPTTPGESVMLLLDNTVCARNKPDLALKILARLAENSEGFFSNRGDADQCAAQILGVSGTAR